MCNPHKPICHFFFDLNRYNIEVSRRNQLRAWWFAILGIIGVIFGFIPLEILSKHTLSHPKEYIVCIVIILGIILAYYLIRCIFHRVRRRYSLNGLKSCQRSKIIIKWFNRCLLISYLIIMAIVWGNIISHNFFQSSIFETITTYLDELVNSILSSLPIKIQHDEFMYFLIIILITILFWMFLTLKKAYSKLFRNVIYSHPDTINCNTCSECVNFPNISNMKNENTEVEELLHAASIETICFTLCTVCCFYVLNILSKTIS